MKVFTEPLSIFHEIGMPQTFPETFILALNFTLTLSSLELGICVVSAVPWPSESYFALIGFYFDPTNWELFLFVVLMGVAPTSFVLLSLCE